MSIFKRWPSIENIYLQKNLGWWLERYPKLADEAYIITEKLHGANFQWYFEPGEPVRCGSRNNFLDINGTFQGVPIQQLYNKHKELLDQIAALAHRFNESYRLFGELIGPKVQKGVDYGKNYKVLYFGHMTNDQLQPPRDYRKLYEAYCVPIVGRVEGLQNAIDFDSRFNSTILGVENNLCEGVVIQPNYKTYQSGSGSYFLLKKKNKEFAEKQKASKIRVVDSEVQALNLEFRKYLTDQRLQGIFSKYEEIQKPDQIGEYIRYMLEDAKTDFVKDFEDAVTLLSRPQLKQVFNVGATIVRMLKGYL